MFTCAVAHQNRARLVRAALIYLALAVRVEERRRAAARGGDFVTLPFEAPQWEDDWKQ